MFRLAAKLIVTAGCLAALPTPAAPRCPELLAAMAARSPRLAAFADRWSQWEARYADDALVQRTIAAIRDLPAGNARIVQTPTFTMSVHVEEKDGHLVVTIPMMQTHGVPEGDRPEAKDTEFHKAFLGILMGLDARADANPLLRRIDVEADHVKNTALPPLLKSLGFRDRMSPYWLVRGVAVTLATVTAVGTVPLIWSPHADWMGRVAGAVLWTAPAALGFLPMERKLRLRLEVSERDGRMKPLADGAR